MEQKPTYEELEKLVQELKEEAIKRNQCEKELQQEQEFSESLLETAQVIILVLDTNGLIVYFNPYMEEISGYRLEDIKGMDWFSVFLPEQEQDRIRELFQKAVLNIQTRGNVNPIVTKDGRERFIEWYDKTLKNTTGDVVGLLAIGQDITEGKQAKEALKKSELYLRTLLEATPAGIILINAETHEVVDINNSAARMIGAPKEQIIGQACHKHICPAEEGQCPITDLGQTVDQSERILLKVDGKPIPILKTAVTITLNGYEYLLESFTDITDHKQTEEQVRESLKEKEMLLEEIHRRVKNNMQIVSSLLNLQSQYIRDRESLEMFNKSRDRILSMAFVHEKLYQSEDLSKIEFDDYIKSVPEYLLRTYGVDPDKVKLNVNCSDVFLGIDKAMSCGLIINELISNALKHAFPEDGEGEITVDFHHDNNRLTLVISDTGTGLSKDIDTSDAKTLGLRLIKSLVNQLGGTIEVERNGGTIFRITFVP